MVLEKLNEALWLSLFLPLFLLASLRLLPFLGRLLRAAVKEKAPIRNGMKGVLSPGEAAVTVLAATVGIGNIVGTSQAIAMGGPGAVFWMWIAALLGIPIKAAEIYLGQKDGRGAMGYIGEALGRRTAWCYAFLAALSALLVGNMAQVNAVVTAVRSLIPAQASAAKLLPGCLTTVLILVSLRGGAKRTGKICVGLVPLMAGVYLAAGSLLLFRFRDRILPSLMLIFREAWTPEALLGAGGGLALRQAMLWGMRRGAFSNEAGFGSAANIHALVRTDSPSRHALWGIAEVSVDTLLLCSISALVILCGGADVRPGTLPGSELMQRSFSSVFGAGFSAVLLAACIAAFGFSTVLGVSVSAGKCARWIGMGEGIWETLFLSCAVLGCLLPTDFIWRCADSVNVLMACPNLLALILLDRGSASK